MFVGEHTAKLDIKGRVIFPAPLKRQIPEEETNNALVLKKDIYENCLLIYTLKEWEFQTDILKKKLNPFNKRHTEFLREYYRGTAELHFDNSNRLLIPKRLLEHLNAKKEIIFASQNGQIEVWAKEAYEAKKANKEDFADLTNDILGGDFKFYTED